jgi:predicted Zn-dependent protease
MYRRDEIKALTDKVLDMANADAVELSVDGGERAGARFANSTITTTLVQYDQQLTISLRHGQTQGVASTDGTPKIGEKLFSESFTLKSEIGNTILRQTPFMADGSAARPVTRIENGVLRNLYYDAATARREKVPPSSANPNMSLVVDGTNLVVEDMIKTTKRGLLVTFLWYLRPVDTLTLLNTAMTRDGLFLIENGEIAGPVQNFRWNMSQLVAFANLSAVG